MIASAHRNPGACAYDRCPADPVDFLVVLHGADLSGKGGAGASGHHNSGHGRAHLTRYGDADQVGDIDSGPKLL